MLTLLSSNDITGKDSHMGREKWIGIWKEGEWTRITSEISSWTSPYEETERVGYQFPPISEYDTKEKKSSFEDIFLSSRHEDIKAVKQIDQSRNNPIFI